MEQSEITTNKLYNAMWESFEEVGIQATCGQVLDAAKKTALKLGIETYDQQLHRIAVLQRALSLATLGPTWDGSTDYMSYLEQAEREITEEGK